MSDAAGSAGRTRGWVLGGLLLLAAAGEDIGVLGDAFAGLEDEQLMAALRPSTGLKVALGLSAVVALGSLVLVLKPSRR